jgi:hypothetical protein
MGLCARAAASPSSHTSLLAREPRLHCSTAQKAQFCRCVTLWGPKPPTPPRARRARCVARMHTHTTTSHLCPQQFGLEVRQPSPRGPLVPGGDLPDEAGHGPLQQYAGVAPCPAHLADPLSPATTHSGTRQAFHRGHVGAHNPTEKRAPFAPLPTHNNSSNKGAPPRKPVLHR